MTQVLRVVKKESVIKPKSWVRVKRGIFQGDIGQVDYVDEAQNQVQLKLIPRIDYSRHRGALRKAQPDADAKKKKRKIRPPCKLFDLKAIRAVGVDFLIFEGNRYSRKGFLYKNFAMSAILADGVKPTLIELERFEEAVEGVDLSVS